MPHAESSGIRLTAEDASLVKGMIARGDRHHDIAAWFGVNQGRIAEVKNGHTFLGVEEAPAEDLPPSGPYTSGKSAHKAIEALKEAREALELAKSIVDDTIEEIS